MLKIVLLSGALVATTASAHAAADRHAFFGGLRITAVSSVCKTEDAARVGETHLFTFQRDARSGSPRDNIRLKNNLQDYAFAAVDSTGARNNFRSSGKLQAVYVFSRGNTGVQDATYSSFALTPSTITATTQVVSITGKIGTYDVPGCTVTFEAIAVRRPD